MTPRVRLVLSATATAGLVIYSALLAYVYVTGIQSAVSERDLRDFGQFYYSTRTFLDSGDMYAANPNARLDEAIDFRNMNPPHFHLLILPIAWMRPLGALVVWWIASIACLAVAVAVIARERVIDVRWPLAALAAFSFPGTMMQCVSGQVAWVLMAPVTLAWRDARRGRWTTAAVWLGAAASLKPFLLVFAPYLLFTRRWRALLVFAATIAIAFAIGVVVFGVDPLRAWVGVLSRVNWSHASWNASWQAVCERAFGDGRFWTPLVVWPEAIRPLGLAGAAVILVVTVATAVRRSEDEAWALLLIAALLASPLGWTYYLWIAVGPLAAAAAAMTRRTEGAEKSHALLGLSVSLLFVPNVLTFLFQPSALASVTIGSVYFWGLLMVWLSLLRGRSAMASGAG